MHADPTALGTRIATLRHAHGWSQRQLADAAGVSHGYVGLLERGRLPSPGKFRLDAIARALDLRTADALLGPLPRDPFGPSHVLTPANGTLGDGPNVVGPLDALRPADVRPLPVYRWGSCGDPRDRESAPDPDHLEYPPPGRESLIGPSGFGVMVKGDSMAGRGIVDGDVVWVNPDRRYQLNKVVLALVRDLSGESGMVVKTYARSEVGECLMSEMAQGQRSPVVCQEFRIIGPVVGITSWRLPG